MLLSDNQPDITIGSGFHNCLDYVFIGKNLYVPFYNDIRIDAKALSQVSSLNVNNDRGYDLSSIFIRKSIKYR